MSVAGSHLIDSGCRPISCGDHVFLTPALVPAAAQAQADVDWAVVTEDDRAVQVETDTLEAVIPNRRPEQWMDGIEKEVFLDKTAGFREVRNELMGHRLASGSWQR